MRSGSELHIPWLLDYADKLYRQQQANSVLLGEIVAEQRSRTSTADDITNAEFRVFSQGGEDGILQFLIRRVSIPMRQFVEFGVEGYREANTRLLLLKDCWTGLVMDSNMQHIHRIEESDLRWRHGLDSRCARVTAENVEDLLRDSGIAEDFGLLSIDVDGNDYWIWRAVRSFRPRIVICEYNSLFGKNRAVTVPYRPDFDREKAHHSSIFFGASLRALWMLAQDKGYRLIGVTRNGVNAFFVREDVASHLPDLQPDTAFVPTVVREAKDEGGRLTLLSQTEALAQIQSMELQDVERGTTIAVGSLT